MNQITEPFEQATIQRLVSVGYDHEQAEMTYRMYAGTLLISDLLDYIDLKELENKGLLGGCDE